MIIRLKLTRARTEDSIYNILFDNTYIIGHNKTTDIDRFFLHDIGERPGEMQGATAYVELKNLAR